MKKRLWKEIMVAVLLLSTILSFSPIAYGETTSVQQQMDALKMEMKKAALTYVEPALKGELVPSSFLYAVLNNVKKNYQETRKIILVSSLSEKEKQTKLKELEALYEEKIVKGLIPYIDAYNYATKYLEPILKEIKEAEAKNDFLAVEKAYHKLSVQLKSRTSILYRFTGKAPRDLLLENYKKPADEKRDEMIVPVTIIMKLTNAQQLYKAGKKEEVKKVIEDIPTLVAKLSSTNPFHQALVKELKRLQTIFFSALPLTPVVPIPPVTPPSTGGGGDSGEPSVPSSVKLAPGSLGKAGNKKITGLIPTTKYVVTKGTNYYGVLANGTLSPVQTTKIEAEKLAVALTGTEITGLTNGHSYKVEVVTPPVGPTKVLVEPGSVTGATAGDKKITGLIPTTKYVVTKGTNYYGVLANGTLSPVQTTKIEAEKLAVALTGTEITGLTNGHSYKVEVVTPPVGPTKVLVEPGSVTGATAGDKKITGLIPTTKYVVTKGTNYYGVLANGTLSPVQTTKIEAEKLAVALTGTEITGLTNGHSYKVEVVTPPTITIADDGSIIEGEEDGEIITVTLSNGKFVSPLDPSAFTLSNSPTGVSKGTVTRISATEVNIALTGNRTTDYDSDVASFQVFVANSQITGYTGAALSDNTGVTFTASNPKMTLSTPTKQALYNGSKLGEKIIAFKATSTVDSIIDFNVVRVGGNEATFGNIKIYIDLNGDGNVDANEQVTTDGTGGTINNGAVLAISYSNQGTERASFSITGLKLTTTQMAYDIMVVGDVGERVQTVVGEYYGFSSKKTVDLIEDIKVEGRVLVSSEK